jgi:hypothetical protein
MHRAMTAQCCVMSFLDPVPERMVGRPFRLSDAVKSGLSMAELSGPLWRAPSHGVRMWDGLAADDPVVRIRVVAATLPSDAVITGWAAAYLLGVQWLDGRDLTTSDDAVLDVVVLRNRDRPPLRRRGLRTLRSAVDVEDVVMADGLCVTHPVRTAFELLRSSPLVEAVASVDAMLTAGLTTVDELADYVRQRPRWRGVPHARRVLELVVPGAESPMESRLRLIWIRGGLPRPLVNVPLYDRDTHGLPAGSTGPPRRRGGCCRGVRRRAPPRPGSASCRQRARTQARAGRADRHPFRQPGHAANSSPHARRDAGSTSTRAPSRPSPRWVVAFERPMVVRRERALTFPE